MLRDLGADGTLSFDTGHGLAFTVSPANVKRAAATSILVARGAAAFYAGADYVVGMIIYAGARRACLCCGYHTLEASPFEICPVCFYQDDMTVLADVRSAGANAMALQRRHARTVEASARATRDHARACVSRAATNVRVSNRPFSDM